MSENTTNDLPELGTAEAAVRSCVNLISRATGQPEQMLAYWLDLYFQVRLNLEQPHPAGCHAPSQPTPFLRNALEDASQAIKVAAVEAFQAAESAGAERTAPEDTQPAAPKPPGAAAAAAFKRATLNRLRTARELGVSVPTIVKMAEGNITEDQVRNILDARPTPVAVYRVLAAALDQMNFAKAKEAARHE